MQSKAVPTNISPNGDAQLRTVLEQHRNSCMVGFRVTPGGLPSLSQQLDDAAVSVLSSEIKRGSPFCSQLNRSFRLQQHSRDLFTAISAQNM